MAPKIVDKHQRRKELASYALETFASDGFENTSVAEIARLCGVGKGTLYEYFDSKEALFVAAVLEWIDQVEKECASIMQKHTAANPVERLRQYLVAGSDAMLENPHSVKMFLVFTQVMVQRPDSLKEYGIVEKSTAAFRRAIVQLIEQAVAENHFPKSTLQQANEHAINLIAGLDGLQLHALMSEGFLSIRKQIHNFIDTYIEGMKYPPGSIGSKRSS